MQKAALVLYLSLSALLVSTPAKAEQKIILSSTNWEPYAADTIENQGFTAEIIKEAFKRSGYSAELVFMPWKRAIIEAEQGKYDGLFSAYYSDERAQKFVISDPYISGPLMLCVRKDFNKDKYSSIKDFTNLTVGVVRGYTNTPEIDGADYIQKDEAVDDAMNMMKLVMKRIDIIVIDKYVALAELQKIKKGGKYNGEIKFLEPPLEMKPVHVMFPKVKADHQKIMEAFNQGLKAIKADGTILKIKEKHGFSDK